MKASSNIFSNKTLSIEDFVTLNLIEALKAKDPNNYPIKSESPVKSCNFITTKIPSLSATGPFSFNKSSSGKLS